MLSLEVSEHVSSISQFMLQVKNKEGQRTHKDHNMISRQPEQSGLNTGHCLRSGDVRVMSVWRHRCSKLDVLHVLSFWATVYIQEQACLSSASRLFSGCIRANCTTSGGGPVNVSEKLHRQITVNTWKFVLFFVFFNRNTHSIVMLTSSPWYNFGLWIVGTF